MTDKELRRLYNNVMGKNRRRTPPPRLSPRMQKLWAATADYEELFQKRVAADV